MPNQAFARSIETRRLMDLAADGKIPRRLEYIYRRIPMNNCRRCAACCFNAPQVYPLEFLNIMLYLWTLRPSKRERLGRKLIEYDLLNLVTLKNKCPFLKIGGCSIYAQRPLQCRLFGLYPQNEYAQMVDGCRRQNEELMAHYAEFKKILLPRAVMTYDIDQCENNIDSSGNPFIIAAKERFRYQEQIAALSDEILPCSWRSPGTTSFSRRYARLYLDDERLENTQIKVMREHQAHGGSETLDGLLKAGKF
jgi:Fe-S-cluster containining protein